MNEANYRMSFDDRRQYAYNKAQELLENDNDVFVEACEELDAWDGFLGDDRCYDMDMIDEFFSRPSELVELMDDFNSNDSYFYYTAYGHVSTCDDKYEVYSDNFSVEEVLDKLIEDYNNISIYSNDSLKEVLEILYNEDFGIEDGWEYDEDNWDGEEYTDEPEETDDEFMNRIDDI